MATINKNLSEYDKNAIPNAKNFRFGIVVSEWNDTITEVLFNGAITGLIENEVPSEHIIRWNVPGSFELIYGAKKMLQTLLLSSAIPFVSTSFANDNAPNLIAKLEAELQQPVTMTEDFVQAEKIKARVQEVEAEKNAAATTANIEKNGYYVERKSYGTGRETEPPRYVKQLNKTWLGDYDALADVDWLDVGLEYRFRYGLWSRIVRVSHSMGVEVWIVILVPP